MEFNKDTYPFYPTNPPAPILLYLYVFFSFMLSAAENDMEIMKIFVPVRIVFT